MTIVRHLLAILLLPVVMTVLVPRWILGAELPLPREIRTPFPVALLLRAGGALLLLGGVALFAWCVALFARVGKGTLAPWDPTRRLVVTGPYRHSRNPMITAVATVLAGEALVARSPRLVAWLALFVLVNQLYFMLVEEPGLADRFGEEYRRYRRAVPRWLPRRRGWTPDDDGSVRDDPR